VGTGRLTKLLDRHWRNGLPAPWGYLFAVACIGIAILIRSSLDWIEGDVPTFAANFPAIILATLLGGFGPGLVAAILSTLVRGSMLAGHAHGLVHLGATHVVDLTFYFGCCALAVWLVHNYRIMLFQLRRQEQHIKLLMRELQHRRQNTFAVVQAIVARTLSHDRDAAKRINDRINALLSADRYLMNAEGQSASFETVLRTALTPYGDARESTKMSLRGDPIALAPELARRLALVFHELATNAAKYGALAHPLGHLTVEWSATDQRATCKWTEQGLALLSAPTRKGFGTLILSHLLDDFGGRITSDFRPEGLACEISFDLDEVRRERVELSQVA
jgi:two-component sensor histidine kinase